MDKLGNMQLPELFMKCVHVFVDIFGGGCPIIDIKFSQESWPSKRSDCQLAAQKLQTVACGFACHCIVAAEHVKRPVMKAGLRFSPKAASLSPTLK